MLIECLGWKIDFVIKRRAALINDKLIGFGQTVTKGYQKLKHQSGKKYAILIEFMFGRSETKIKQ